MGGPLCMRGLCARVCVCAVCVLRAVWGLCVDSPLYMCGLCVCCVVGGGLCLGESPQENACIRQPEVCKYP